MKHAVPAYLEWWRAYLALSHGCSQLMLKSMQQMLDASMAAWVYRPSMQAARLPMMMGNAWMWPVNIAAYSSLPSLRLVDAKSGAVANNSPEMQQVMAQVIRLVASPRQ